MMKKLLPIAGLLVLLSGHSATAKWIQGHEYPNGCEKYTLVTGEWGIKCPSMNSNPQNKYWSNRKVQILPGHANTVEIAPEPKFQEPIKCRAATKRMESMFGDLWKWFKIVRYGTPDERVLTGPVAKEMYERLRTYILLAIETGDNKYRFGTRYEDRDGACATYIDTSRQEVLRVFNIIKVEGARGNRDLIGTGLNPRPSQFNR